MRLLYLIGLAIVCLIISCETEYEPDTSDFPTEYVVEGFIEFSNQPTPTYVFLTKSLPFYERIDEQTIADAFVRDATVVVSSAEGQRVTLTEVCLDELDPEVAKLLSEQLVVNGIFSKFCVYLDVNSELEKIPGTTYNLEIEIDENRLTASTTIPDTVSVKRLFHEKPAGNVADIFYDFGIEISEPGDQVNFYRTLVGVNSLPLYSNNASVFDDVFINGETFSFPIARPVYPGEDFSVDSVGLYIAGDTVHLKWMTLDHNHYEFWASLEFDSNNGGPFASYTRANSNIDGGLGVWGGYGAFYYDYIIPK